MARLLSPARVAARALLATPSLRGGQAELGAALLSCAGGSGPAQQQHQQLLPQLCRLHSPAAHAYHHDGGSGSRSHSDDEAPAARDGAEAASAQQQQQPARAAAAAAEQARRTRALEEALERASEAVEEGRRAREAAQLPEHVARTVLADPLGMLMSSRGVPLGISLRVKPAQQQAREAEADRRDWRELLGSDPAAPAPPGASSRRVRDGRGSAHSSSDDGHTSLPSTDAQLLRRRLIHATQALVQAATRSRGAEHEGSSGGSEQVQQEAVQEPAAAGEAAQEAGSEGGSRGGGSGSPVGQQAREQLQHLLAAADADRWGTTQQSAAEIAQHIADSNRAARGGGGSGGGSDGEDEDDDSEPLALSPQEQRYSDPSAVAAELKEMDEIYEVLAKVPWLDDGDVDERELRGVVAVGLLGTLEEVGWHLRERLLLLWAGERDGEVLTAGVPPREAAALAAILFHTQRLEAEYGQPPSAGVAAALAAAGRAPQQEE